MLTSLARMKRPVEPLKAAEVNGWMDLSDEYPPYRGASSSITVRMCPIRHACFFFAATYAWAKCLGMDDRAWYETCLAPFGPPLPPIAFSFVFFRHFFVLLSMINPTRSKSKRTLRKHFNSEYIFLIRLTVFRFKGIRISILIFGLSRKIAHQMPY